MSQATRDGAQHAGTSRRLRGKLGPLMIAFMVWAGAAPLTIMVSTPVNMLNGNGAGTAFSYIVGPLILLLFGVGFAKMSIHVKKSGAFYSYITASLGRPAGVGAGFLAVLGYLVFQAFVYMLLGITVEGLLTSFLGTGLLPWWGWSVVALALVAFLGYVNIDVSARVIAVVLVLEVLVILVLDLAILLQGGGPEGVQVLPFFSPETITSGSLPLGLLYGISVGLGFEATAIFRDEARDPDRTIPRSIYLAIIGAMVFYGFAVWAWMQAFGISGVMDAVAADPAGVVYATAGQWVGTVFLQITMAVSITSMFACVLVYHNIPTRYLHSLGHSVLPRRLTWVHDRFGSPYVASLTITVIGVVLLLLTVISGLDPFVVIGWEISIGTLSPLILFALTSIAIVVFFRRNRRLRVNVWASLVSPLIAFVLLAGIAVVALLNFSVLSGADPAVGLVLQLVPLVVFVAGVVVAFVVRRVAPARYAGLVDEDAGAARPDSEVGAGKKEESR